MENDKHNAYIAEHFDKLCGSIHVAQAACESAVGRLHGEAALSLVHQLLETHRGHLAELKKTQRDASLSFTGQLSRLGAQGAVALGALSEEPSVVRALVAPHEAVALELDRIAAMGSLAPQLLADARDRRTEMLRHVQTLRDLAERTNDVSAEARRAHDEDEIKHGRAMPRMDAQAPRINNSADY